MESSYENDILLRVFRGDKVERPPVWLMRQAGRILPQYRAIRGSLSGFKELVQTPALAAEVTVQPVDELGVDAAILFSDILVIPEAMGLDYNLIEKVGPRFPKVIESLADVEALREGQEAAKQLSYVYDGIVETKRRLEGRVPLLGFSGAPWTLFAYMLEGQGSKTFSKAKRFLYQEPEASHMLLAKITESIIAYLNTKINAGVDAVQLFDSWAGVLNRSLYEEFCMPYLKQIVNRVQNAPFIMFPRGASFCTKMIVELNPDALGLDWTVPVEEIRQIVGNDIILQGNLDPCILYGEKNVIEKAVVKTIEHIGSKHVMNLGHGVYPDTPLENVKHFVKAVKNYRY